MPKKFVLIEHSMMSLGGHYYTYACSVLEAAERAGYLPVLATHQDFTEFDALPRSWSVHALFPRRSQWLHTPATPTERGIDSGWSIVDWWQKLNRERRARRRLRRTAKFARACATLFDRVELASGDHVLIATASDLDVHGLAQFLKSSNASRQADWHLQFHHPIFRGRDPDYELQTIATKSVRELFRAALDSIPHHRVRLYCTTEQLTTQYLRLGVAQFQTLPYVVHAIFHSALAQRPASRKIQIACLGQMRPEKGDGQLPILIRELWDDHLQNGRAQLVLQTGDPHLRENLDKMVATLGPCSDSEAPLRYAPFPLDLARYAELVRTADVGLLIYDSEIYYARCSGLLLELLMGGVPIIVPAGCWLADQIAEDTQLHLEQLATANSIQRLCHADLRWQRIEVVPAVDAKHGNDTEAILGIAQTTCQLEVAPGTTALLISFRWSAPNARGVYLRLDLEEVDEQDVTHYASSSIVSQRPADRRVHVLLRLSASATRLRLSWRNAWHTEASSISDVQCTLLNEPHPPAGIVGLTTQSIEQVPELLRDILENLEHYRRGAAALGERFAQIHCGDRAVQQLTSEQRSLSIASQ